MPFSPCALALQSTDGRGEEWRCEQYLYFYCTKAQEYAFVFELRPQHCSLMPKKNIQAAWS